MAQEYSLKNLTASQASGQTSQQPQAQRHPQQPPATSKQNQSSTVGAPRAGETPAPRKAPVVQREGAQGQPSLNSSSQGLERMKEILLEMGVKPAHVHVAIARAKETDEPLAQIMRDFGFLSGEQVADAVSRQSGLEYFPDTAVDQIDRTQLEGLSIKDFRGYCPVGRDADGRLMLAVPDASGANEAQNTFFQHRPRLVIASEHTIQTVYRRYFANTEALVDQAIGNFMDNVATGRKKDEDEFSSGYVRDVLFALLRHACYAGASDIYLFQSEYVGVVKLKVNGVGAIFRTLDIELYARVLNKLIAENTKAEELRREPKDTFINFNDDDRRRLPDIVNRWGFRLELAETRGKRTAVMRLIDRNSAATDVDKLGFDEESFRYIKAVSNTSNGFFLVTGPTGSGKTTSLYAVLKSIDPVERSIQSIENPIEYTHGLWMQYEVRKDATNEGEEYNKWLKALLRNAPDVILVGEVRDREVANICLNAANTGHLVFATLHTNNAVLALGRLRSMNLDLDVLASVLLGILAQRLIRTLCKTCKEPDDRKSTKDALSAEGSYLGSAWQSHKAGAGCPNCDFTGYRGRRMIYEVLRITPTVRDAIERNEPPSSIARKGMKPERTIWASGMRLVADGITSLDELNRVATKEF